MTSTVSSVIARCLPVTALWPPVMEKFRRSTGSTRRADNGLRLLASESRPASRRGGCYIRRRRMTRPLATLVFVLVAVPALALAKPRVALVPLDNDSGGDVQDAVVDALDGGELAIVGPKQVARAADKLGLD